MTQQRREDRLSSILRFLDGRRVVILSNRLPYTPVRDEKGLSFHRSVGGLVTTIDPILRKLGGLWIGWEGGVLHQNELKRFTLQDEGSGRYEIKPIHLDERQVTNFYYGFANRTLWPLFHSFIVRTQFSERFWHSYIEANEIFARSLAEDIRDNDILFIQDYHLLLVPQLLKKLRPDVWPERGSDPASSKGPEVLFFLHIPFPPYEVFSALPWREQILQGLLGASLVGFHTENYAANFLDSVEKILGLKVDRRKGEIYHRSGVTRVGSFPISIDYSAFQDYSTGQAVETRLKRLSQEFEGKVVMLGLDRLDYTKGIKERLLALERFFHKYPSYRRRVVFIQISVPSRTRVEEYRMLKREIDEMVGRVNGELTEAGWIPVHYIYRAVPFDLLVALYRLADVALVLPLRDGLNLVAKEYCAAKIDEGGALMLSEFAGAAMEMKDAFLVNPYNTEMVADALAKILEMNPNEKRERMRRLRAQIESKDLFAWLDEFFRSVGNGHGNPE